ncbi:THO complex, subunit THOC1 [Polychytrium aggregatum]|uniref:THO complex, subunit THOC1 n=1 Tax=Polychytrium aggregatum TaxID=110093 RepID=UPI0022FE1FE0|nr:THO complex, subunit THOC1 [Polychytrium aggregatum]KAI9209228.1 THO complex, subunit THOC1 [Polychytrium aggregatum]
MNTFNSTFHAIRSAIAQTLGLISSSASGSVPKLSQRRDDQIAAVGSQNIAAAVQKGSKSHWEYVSLAFKSIWESYIKDAEAESDTLFQQLYTLLDLSIWCSEHEYADAALSLSLLEDILDSVTIDGAERLLDYLEARRDRLTMGMEPSKGKGLTLLRMCNEYLKRLSKTKHTVTCGRILIFLANVFPLTERSGVNLKGDFNVENLTHFEDLTSSGLSMDVDSDEAEQDKKIDELYKTFWGLQKYFSNPILLINPDNFAKFQQATEIIFTEFDRILLEIDGVGMDFPGSRADSSQGKRKRDAERASSDRQEHFFPKFLTSRNLFQLELKDPLLRRQILTQYTIVLQYLTQQTQKEKERLQTYFAENPKAQPNKPLLGQTISSFAGAAASTSGATAGITEEQERWINDIRSRVAKMVERIPPRERSFAKSLTTLVSHEKHWIKWKNESCLSFEKEASKVEDGLPKRKLEVSLATQKDNIGNARLNRMWAMGREMQHTIQDKNQRFVCLSSG